MAPTDYDRLLRDIKQLIRAAKQRGLKVGGVRITGRSGKQPEKKPKRKEREVQRKIT